MAKRLGVCAGLLALGLTGTAFLTVPSGAAVHLGKGQAVQGVDANTIEVVVLASDADALRDRGIRLAPQITSSNLVRRMQTYIDAYGRINGREVVLKPVYWDATDATSFTRACVEATQDNKPFLVVNPNGYRADAASCIAADNRTPMFLGESAYKDLFKMSGKNLVSLALPAEVNGAAAAAFVDKARIVPASAKVAILSSNEPQRKAAADVLEKELKKRKYTITKRVEVNTLQADTAAINRESAAAVETLQAAGVDTVFMGLSPTTSVGYFQEFARSNPSFKNYLVDTAGSLCTPFSAPRFPTESAGLPCITTYDSKSVPTKDAIKKDTPFEAKCRAQYAKATGWTPYPGAQSGGTDVAGQHWDEDFPKEECTMVSVLFPAIEAAGKNVTWDKVYKNLIADTKAPMAYMSNGEGGFAKDKPYMANQVHMVVLNLASASTSKDANGTYAGCPLPANCWVPQVVDGQEWYAAPPM